VLVSMFLVGVVSCWENFVDVFVFVVDVIFVGACNRR
jgi:hypothetical protein